MEVGEVGWAWIEKGHESLYGKPSNYINSVLVEWMSSHDVPLAH